tara:strand:+ start:468 stop:677 length:210 start_codon:yes stop_codon:yes gene_type:complete
MRWWIFDRLLSIEFRMGVGLFDLEAVESKPVWVYNMKTEETTAMPMDGLILLLPFLIISYGYVYDIEEI